MARLARDRSGKFTKVTWIEDTPWARRPGLPRYDGKTSRSRQLNTEEQALLFKGLVEQHGEKWPPYTALQQHGLTEFGYPIAPRYVLNIRKIVFESEHFTAEEKIEFLKRALEDF